MEQEITVIVRVSNGVHAQRIRQDVEEAVELRTPIYWIGEPTKPREAISYKQDHKKTT